MSLWSQSHILNPNEYNTILILQILVPISVHKDNKVEYTLGWAYLWTEKQLPYKHVVSFSFTAVLVMSGFKNADDSHNTELKVLGTGLYKLVGEPTPRGEVSIVWQLLSE